MRRLDLLRSILYNLCVSVALRTKSRGTHPRFGLALCLLRSRSSERLLESFALGSIRFADYLAIFAHALVFLEEFVLFESRRKSLRLRSYGETPRLLIESAIGLDYLYSSCIAFQQLQELEETGGTY